MEVIQVIKQILWPSHKVEPEKVCEAKSEIQKYEVEPERFYSEFLKPVDAQSLRPFVLNLGGRLSVPSAILAVGSSVFPREYWDEMKREKERNPDAEVDISYGDIDLLVVPESITRLTTLERSVQDVLDSLILRWEAHENTLGGHTNKYLILDYGLHSVSTLLGSGTELDLILGRDDLLKTTAKKKIAKERKFNTAFSLLYRRPSRG